MNRDMRQLESNLITTKYTKVMQDANYELAPTYFQVLRVSDGFLLGEIHFQNGAIKESGVNGIMNEDLIAMAIRRLECFQNTKFKCRENAMAITKLEEALMWLRKRTNGRENKGIEGTHKI